LRSEVSNQELVIKAALLFGNIMNIYMAVIFLYVPLIALAQSEPQMDRQSFVSLSDSFAYELGKAYQMGKNCKKELSNIAPSKASSLFLNYMAEHEVQGTMSNYERGMKVKSGKLCERKELKSQLRELRVKIPEYTKAAVPFMRSQASQ
jgi:hypothetical protein